ncbi:MAG: hypothetical protein ACYC1C_10675, partial [Chloroflexota bacterium]
MKSTTVFGVGVRVVGLALLLYLLHVVDFTGLGLMFIRQAIDLAGLEPNQAILDRTGVFLLWALLASTAMSYPVLRSRWTGWRLVAAVFLAFFALTAFLVALEGYYMSDVVSMELAVSILINGAIVAIVFAFAVVATYGKLTVRPAETGTAPRPRAWWSWVLRFLSCGVAYVAVFIFAGAVLFQPLALALAPAEAPGYFADFANNVDPFKVLAFQFVRGIIWAALTLPILMAMRGSRWQRG